MGQPQALGEERVEPEQANAVTVVAAMQWGAKRLARFNIENCRADADLLLGKVLGLSRDRLYIERDRLLKAKEWSEYKALIERRAGHEPLQYLLGKQEFMGLVFYVDERVLIPRPETELLVEKALELKREIAKPRPAILDLCTGSGAIAIAIKYYWPEAQVTGADISSDALAVARMNARNIGADVRFCLSDCFDGLRGAWDVIVTNPPYVSAEEYRKLQPEIYYEPKLALLGGVDGLDFYRKLAAEGRTYLAPGGVMLMEIGAGQGPVVCRLLQGAGFRTELYQDFAGRDRVVLARSG